MIRARRKELGLTLTELANKSGLSAPFIHRLKRNQTIPSLVSLLKLAKSLDVDISYFMEVPQDSSVVHRSDNLKHIEIDSPVEYFQLGASMPDQKMDAILMKIPQAMYFQLTSGKAKIFCM